MDNFIVSARKYRPITFDTVVGQHSITNTLKNAIRNNHLAQAFLFTGPRGVGKTTCARILAKTINCLNQDEKVEACDECESCTSFNQSASFNIHELDAASNNSVDDIRNLVEQVRIPPQVGQYKVYIIDEVHMLSSSAFNAFLKTLEEPPAYAKFILATTEKHKIIPTILSRCQIFDFKRIVVDDIIQQLRFVAEKEGVEAEDGALHIIATKADGAMRDALSIFDQLVSFEGNSLTYKNVIENLNVLDYDYFFKIINSLLEKDISKALLILDEILENGFDGHYFIIGLAEHLRNLMVAKDPATIKLLEVAENLKESYLEQSAKCSLRFIFDGLSIASKSDMSYKASNNKRLHLELALMQMAAIESQTEKKKSEPELIAPLAAKTSADKESTPAKTNHKEKVDSKQEETQTPPDPSSLPSSSLQPSSLQPSNAPTPKKSKALEAIVTPGTISIKDSMLKEESKPKEEFDDDSNKPADVFTNEKLEELWFEYLESISFKHPSFAHAMAKYKPVLKADFVIEFKTDNKIIASDAENIANMLGYLKRQLNNYRITLKPFLNEKAEDSKAYTDREKFERMARQNPALKKLKDQLDLEIDF